MLYSTKYQSPLGEIILTANEAKLTGLWFAEQNYETKFCVQQENSALKETRAWLDEYFSGKKPNFQPKLELVGTDFQKEVWRILETIPYGKTMTYGEIAKTIARQRNVAKMSAQAIGGAVGKNKISLIIPCHRVVGSNNKIIGYAGGIERKTKLLELERFGQSSWRNRQEQDFAV